MKFDWFWSNSGNWWKWLFCIGTALGSAVWLTAVAITFIWEGR